MESTISKPCIDKDEVDSSSSAKNTIASSKATPQSPSSSTSNSHSSPSRDRTKDGTETSPMLLQSQSRLRISRQGVVVQPLQSQDGNESPATKRSRVEDKADGSSALPPLAPLRASIRAISSNHDSPNPRGRYDDALTGTALSRENLGDTSGHSTVLVTVAEQKEFPSDSSPATTNGGTTERTVDRAVASAAGSDGVVPCRNPPMKRAKILGTNDVEVVIRIPTSTETQITTRKPKLVTLTGTSTFTGICASASTNHITQNNTANPPSPKSGDNNSDLSMAVLQESNAVAKSSTTESSSTSSLTPPASATPTTTAIHSKASLSSSCTGSARSSGETMSAKGNAVENALPLTRCENDNTACTSNPKPSTAPTTTTTTKTTIITTHESITINNSSSEGKASTSTGPSQGTKPQASTAVKPEPATPKHQHQPETTPTMSVIKASVVRQALSSAPTNSLPANQVKPAPTHVVHKTSTLSVPSAPTSSSSSTPSTTPTKKKRPAKRKRSGSNGSSSSTKPKGQSSGRWTQEEHQAFLEGLTECGREWKKVALRIPTRTSAQIRSHAQKYFAKLQRDQESSATNVHAGLVHGEYQYQFAAATPMTPASAGLVVGVGGLSGTIITAPNAATLAPSVRRNVERIVANPRAAQREVETTMVALRERYRQLQQRLEERRRTREERKKLREQQQQQQQQSQPFSPASHHTAASSDVSTFASPPSIPPQQQQQQQQVNSSSSSSPGKPMHLPTNPRKYDTKSTDASRRSPTGDDNSSVCSNVSSIAASRTDLGNEEIIALQVLGGDLPRSESASDIHVMGDVLQGRGDSSIEADGTMPSMMNENISSSSYDHQLAPLPGVGGNNDNDSLMNHPQGDSVTTTTVANNNENHGVSNTNGGGDAATSESISVGGISALEDPTTMATNATTAT